jgi:putative toxin-antitoxin system antitoxin component (TIGR02293 family)
VYTEVPFTFDKLSDIIATLPEGKVMKRLPSAIGKRDTPAALVPFTKSDKQGIVQLALFSDTVAIAKNLDLEDDEVSPFLQEFLNVSERTVSRRLDGEPLSPHEQLKLEMLEDVTNVAVRMFGDKAKALQWLKTPLLEFDNQTALDTLKSIRGYNQVKDAVIAQAHGMF